MAVSQERCRHAPAWSQDLLDSSEPPEVQPPLFDTALGAWVLTRRSDIVAAFRTTTLAMTGFDSTIQRLCRMRALVDRFLLRPWMPYPPPSCNSGVSGWLRK